MTAPCNTKKRPITRREQRKKQKERLRIESIKKTQGLLAAITRVPSKFRHVKGFRAEESALKAANYWYRKKLILNARATQGLSPEDRSMKDIVLTLLDGQEKALQVKSYFHVDMALIRRCRQEGIYLFCMDPQEEEETTKRNMRDLIFSIYLDVRNPQPHQLLEVARQIAVKDIKKPKGFLAYIRGLLK